MKLARPLIPPKKGQSERGRGGRRGVGGSPRRSRFATLRGKNSRHARAVVPQLRDKLRRFRRLGIKTFCQIGRQAPQNNFQFLLRKIWRAGVKKLKENCFALHRHQAGGNAERS